MLAPSVLVAWAGAAGHGITVALLAVRRAW
jgi:hypothetical protein